MVGRTGINSLMKTTFRQFLTESKIQIPTTTFKQAMSIVASAYFSHLARLHRIDEEEPGPEFDEALRAAQGRYGDVQVYELDRNGSSLSGKVVFRTSELPARYRKSIRTRDYTLKLFAGPREADEHGDKNDGEYYEKSKGDAAAINVNILAVQPTKAVYNPKLIPQQLHRLESIVDHELQHMVQDVALKHLHPAQSGNTESRLAGQHDDDAYYNSQEEFSPQITTVAAEFVNEIRGTKGRENIQAKFFEKVDPRKEGNVHPFFSTLFRTNPQKWKKAVKEFHRLIQGQL